MIDSVAAMWNDFVASDSPAATAARGASYTSWHFGTGGAMADELVGLVVSGRKRATAGALWSYEAEGDTVPQPGEFSVVTDGDGRARCIIRTTSVEIVPFNQVSAEFAAAEGEGDLTLDYWREGHWRYFTSDLAQYDLQPAQGMPVVCERFEVVYAPVVNRP